MGASPAVPGSGDEVALSDDPKLGAILDEIELRVAVELAKLEKVA